MPLPPPHPTHLTPPRPACAAFRRQHGRLNQLYKAYSSSADFINVYISEAHPKGGWSFGGDHPQQQEWLGLKTEEQKAEYDRWDVAQPATTAERLAVAREWVADLGGAAPCERSITPRLLAPT